MPKEPIKENQPSEEIAEYIGIANLFPDCELKGLINFVESIGSPEIDDLVLLTGDPFLEKLESDGYVERWLETIKPFPALYIELIKHPRHVEKLDIRNLIYRFQTFDHIQQITKQVADFADAQRANKGFLGALPWAAWAVDGNGNLFISTSRFAEAFVGCGIARIKRCANCRKIIWAYRLNRNYCDIKCSNDFHQKKLRRDPVRNQAVNEQRKANRQIKKNVKKIKSKNNGTL